MNTYILSKNYEEGYKVFLSSVKKFPESWRLYIYGGTLCELLGRYDEAFELWDRAGEIGTYFHDELYCKASCYEDMGEIERAYELYIEIAGKLRADSFDVEADMADGEAERIKTMMNN